MCDSFTESRSLWTGGSFSAHLMQAQLLSAGLDWCCSSAATKKRVLEEGYPREKMKKRVWKAEDSKTKEAASITTWGRAGVRKRLGRESLCCGGKRSPGRTRDDIERNFRRISGYSLHLPSLRNAEHHLKSWSWCPQRWRGLRLGQNSTQHGRGAPQECPRDGRDGTWRLVLVADHSIAGGRKDSSPWLPVTTWGLFPWRKARATLRLPEEWSQFEYSNKWLRKHFHQESEHKIKETDEQ